MPRRVDDLSDPSVPAVSREIMSRRGIRSAIVVPLFSQGDVIGTLNAVHHEPRAFTEADVEVLMEVARPLASAVGHMRLHAEIVQRAEELAALNRTSQLITARLDLRSVLEAISRSVTGLMASTGCGIGLFNADRTAIDHAAAHGFRTPEWRLLSVPIGEGIIGRAAASGQPVRSDDLRADARSAQRDVDENEGMRSMLSVPLRVAGEIIGVISAFSTTPGFFTDRHPMLLEAFADQAGAAILDGTYQLPQLPPGDYTVTFTLSGMATATKKVRVQLSEITAADASMGVGGVTESVTVTGEVTLVDKTSASITSGISNSQITHPGLHARPELGQQRAGQRVQVRRRQRHAAAVRHAVGGARRLRHRGGKRHQGRRPGGRLHPRRRVRDRLGEQVRHEQLHRAGQLSTADRQHVGGSEEPQYLALQAEPLLDRGKHQRPGGERPRLLLRLLLPTADQPRQPRQFVR